MNRWDSPFPPVVLLVDDSPTDVLLVREALDECSRPVRIIVLTDGVAALEYLRRSGGKSDDPVPDLILLDLNLPRLGGLEVLAEIRADIRLKPIPVVVLSTSTAASDVQTAYSLNANCYLPKPLDFDRFAPAVRTVIDFWFGTVLLPKVV